MKIFNFDAVLEFPPGPFVGQSTYGDTSVTVNGEPLDCPAKIVAGQYLHILTYCNSLSGWVSSVGVYDAGTTVVLENAQYDGAFNGVCGRWTGVEWEETEIPLEAPVSSFLGVPTWGQYVAFSEALSEALRDKIGRKNHSSYEIGPHGTISFEEARSLASAWLRGEAIELAS